MTPQEHKERLRRQAAALPRAHVPHLMEQFLALPQVEAAHTVMVFYGVGREPDTTPLMEQLLAMGKRVVLPVCLPQRKMEARAITSLDQLIPNHYGIPEPDGDCPIIPPGDIDVVLGGHTHTFMEKPMLYRDAEGKEVPLLHSGKNGVYVGRIDLDVTQR